jgi:hypothetical protein
MGTYPSFAFTPDDSAVIIWAAGKIWNVPTSVNHYGERVAGVGEGKAPTPIEFTAHMEIRIAETRSSKTDLLALETADRARSYAFNALQADASGKRVVYHSAGKTYIHKLVGGRGERNHPERIPHSHTKAPYYSPSFVPNAEYKVVHARWSDVNFTTFELADLNSGRSFEFTGLPLGRYHLPTVCACSGNKRTLAFVKTGGDYLTGNLVATARPGLYLATFKMPTHDSFDTIELEDVRFAYGDFDGEDIQLRMRFLETNSKLLLENADLSIVLDLGKGADKEGKYQFTKLATGRTSAQLAVSPPKGKHFASDHVAFVDFHHVYVAPAGKADEAVWSRPGNASAGLTRLSLDGGHDIAWSADGKKLFWLLGEGPIVCQRHFRADTSA